ncbi:DUF2339 domain-containing protein [Undibacterium sp. Di24W]|uniref:DUF2339 domain-containing protein n=1 Tax=Undibacterium sp. Di24W TaxID=3413033 RepID=UPI003BF2EF23
MWWIGALIGLALGLGVGGSGMAFIYTVCGAIFGLVVQINLSMRFDTLKKTNQTLHEQAAAALNELRKKISSLEQKIKSLEEELRAYRSSSSNDEVQTAANIVTETSTQAETTVRVTTTTTTPVDTQNQSTQLHSNQEPELNSVMQAAIARAKSDLTIGVETANDLSLVPQTPELALELVNEQAVSNVAVPTPITFNTIATPTIEAPPVKPVARKLAPPPSKTFRESLPQPIADFIYGGNILVKVGVLILFLGLAFLLRYTAERVTVPVELRYVGVALTGLVLLGLGWRLRNKRRDYALSLQGMAIGVFYLTILSALKVHALIAPEIGFAFLFAISVLSAALAVLQRAPALAIIAALEGFAAPILTSTGTNRPLGLFTYLAILDVGIFLVAWFNAWRVLNVIAFVGTFTLSIGWANKFYADSDYALVQPFLIFFFVLFALIGVLFARRTLSEARHTADLAQQAGNPLAGIKIVGRVDSALVFGNPITAFGLQYLLVQHTEFGAAFSALAVAFFYLLLGRLIFSKEKQGLALLAEAYVIVAAIFATLAIPLGLEGTWTSAAWAVEGAGMFWLGTRQDRPYARAFAFVVIAGATIKLLNAISINALPEQALLEGSLLGPVLLGLSALSMWAMHLRRSQENIARWESAGAAGLPWLGIAALTLLPWLLLRPTFAAATCAALALLVSDQGIRRQLPALRPIAATMQAFSLISFMMTLHVNGNAEQQSFLQDGWRGMLAAVIIATSILFNAGRHMLRRKRESEMQGIPPSWSVFNSVALISAFSLLHIAMLFALTLPQAAAIWPLTASLILAGALHMSHAPLATFALMMQAFSALLFIAHRHSYATAPFMNLGFFAALSLAVSGWWSGDQIRVEAQRFLAVLRELSVSNKPQNADTNLNDSNANFRAWLNPWCNQAVMLWLPVLWGLAWWLMAWLAETASAFTQWQLPAVLPNADIAIGIVTAALLLILAKWRDWRPMGLLSAVSLGLFIYAADLGMTGSLATFLPSSSWGILAWPCAFIWHWFALKQQAKFYTAHPRLLAWLHILGLWLALFIISAELRGQFSMLSESTSSWVLLAWILAPALTLFGLGSRFFAQRWPVSQYRTIYLQEACTPIALYLLIWCWISNILSAGNASPLPYLPVLNPLELAQFIILLSLYGWWQHLPEGAKVKLPKPHAYGVLAMTSLALLTGIVLRSVHHFGSIPWDFETLFASRLAQASVSIAWALCGVGLMLFGNRRASRTVWIAGVVLLGIVALKLFAIELAGRGDLYRMVSFIGVGIAFLVVGYFAPVPVKSKAARETVNEAAENVTDSGRNNHA